MTRLQKQNDFQFEEKEFLPATCELQKTLQVQNIQLTTMKS